MKKSSITILFLVLTLIFASNCKSQQNENGLEIYIQNVPNPILTKKNPSECYCCLEIYREKLSSKPLISDN